MKLKQRLRIMMFATAAGFLVFSSFAFYTLQQLNVSGPLYDRIVLGKDLIADILPPPNYIIESYLITLQMVQTEDNGTIGPLTSRFRDLKKEYDTRHQFWLDEQDRLEPKIREVYLGPAHESAEKFYEIAERAFLPAIGAHDKAQAVVVLAQLANEYAKHRKAIDQVVTLTNKYNQNTEADAKAQLAQSKILMIAILVLSMGGVIGLVFMTQRQILKQLGGEPEVAVRMAHQISSGDLTTRIELVEGDTDSLLATLSAMQTSLRALVEKISSHSGQLASAAEEMSAVTLEGTNGINSQHMQIDQVASAVNELALTVGQVAASTAHSAKASRQASDSANKGKATVGEVLSAIEGVVKEIENGAQALRDLEKESSNIGAVVDVISGVAAQTNLLALNAAIEAARAGEQGRGFAVVADEVRTLASRTQTSTQEIQQMVNRLQQGAKQAVEVMQRGQENARGFVTQAGSATASMESIVSDVHIIDDLNTQVATTLEEQRAVTADVSRHISELAGVAQSLAVGSKQTAAASSELAKLATDLSSIVGRFRL